MLNPDGSFTYTPDTGFNGSDSFTYHATDGTFDSAAATVTITVNDPANVCSTPANEIVAENCLPGNPSSQWDVSGAGDPSIQGFATDISVNRGDTIAFKIDTTAAVYDVLIYRLGYYGGDGARLVIPFRQSRACTNRLAASRPSRWAAARPPAASCSTAATGRSRPAGLCRDAVSGVYIAGRLARTTAGPATSPSSCETTPAFRAPLPDLRHYLAVLQRVRRLQPHGCSGAADGRRRSATTGRSPPAAPSRRTTCSTPSTR